MKKYLWIAASFLFVLCLGSVVPLFFKSEKRKHYSSKQKSVLLEEKPFVVIIPSYNNVKYCEQNLRSVLEQNYNNFRVIYIDDCSTDGTYAQVERTIKASKQEKRVTLIKNQQNKGSLSNFYTAIHSCDDREIIVAVDGDDFLAHPDVLRRLNQIYNNRDVWLTYGNYVDYPTYKQKPLICKKIPSKIIQNNRFRKHPWITAHLKTFYAGLFKKIRQEDLYYKGRFLPMAGDIAFMFPMLEMAGKHIHYIREILYLYNRGNPINDHKVDLTLQSACDQHIRQLPAYERLKTPPF